MARLFTCGFELAEANEQEGPLVGQASHSIVLTPRRTGFRAWAIYVAGTNVLNARAIVHAIPASTELYARAAVYVTNPVGIAPNPLNFIACFNNNACLAALGIRCSDNRLIVTRNGAETMGQKDATDVVAGYVALRDRTWYVVEMYIKVGDATNGRIITKVNGVTDIDYTGATDVVAANITSVRFGANGQANVGQSNVGRDIVLDDLALNDTNGTQQNGWIGVGGVYPLFPNADGTWRQWVPSTGSDHYALVDEVPADGSDYVYSAANAKDTYALTDLPPRVDQIRLIEVIGQFTLSNVGSRSVRALVVHNGTTYTITPNRTITTTAPTLQLVKSDPIYEVLGGSGAWSRDQINALECGWEAL